MMIDDVVYEEWVIELKEGGWWECGGKMGELERRPDFLERHWF